MQKKVVASAVLICGRSRSVSEGESSTPFYTSCARGVRGECCRMISPNGKPSTIISGNGVLMELGNGFMNVSGNGCALVKTENRLQARQFWTVKLLKPQQWYPLEVGYDSGKKIKGRKRHILVDTLGLLVVVVITAANGARTGRSKTSFRKA